MDVDTVLVSTALFLLRGSTPSIVTEVAAPVSEKDLLTGWEWAEGNRLTLGHSDLDLDTPVGDVVATAADVHTQISIHSISI